MNIQSIMETLPHRYPFLLVDRVLDVTENKIVAKKNITINEPYFEGHFKENPIVPSNKTRRHPTRGKSKKHCL